VSVVFRVGRKEFWELFDVIDERIHRTVKSHGGAVQRTEGDRAQRGQA